VADEASVEFRDNLDFVFESDNEDSKTEEEDELEYPPPNYFHQVPLVLDDDLEKAIQEKVRLLIVMSFWLHFYTKFYVVPIFNAFF